MSVVETSFTASGDLTWRSEAMDIPQLNRAITENLNGNGYYARNVQASRGWFSGLTVTFTIQLECLDPNIPGYRQNMANILHNANLVGNCSISSDQNNCDPVNQSIQQSIQNLFGGGGGSGGGGTVSGNTYTVVSGDTFNRIAARFGLTPAQLHALNPQITNINLIHVGQVLTIRGAAQQQQQQQMPQVVTAVNTNTGAVQTVSGRSGNPPPLVDPRKNWFDRTFFDGAGALTGTAIGVLVVLGAVVVVKTTRG